MIKKTKLLIFDIDGTLIDSVLGYHEVIINAMTDLGIREIDSNFNALKHHTDSYALKYNYENFFKKELPIALLNDFEDLIVMYLKSQPKTIAIKGVSEVLAQLENSEYAIVFATGSLPESAIYKMNSAGLPMEMALLATSKTSFSREGFVTEAIQKAKNFYKATEFEEIIAVGDGIWDLKTAQNLSLQFIGIGAKNKSVMETNGMEHWFEDFSSFQVPLFETIKIPS